MAMIEVACAVIVNSVGKVLVAQRSSTMDLPGKWEFPGGKIETGETPQECIIREIREELGISVSIISALDCSVHKYPAQTVRLIPFICRWIEGNIYLTEHSAVRWLRHQDLLEIDLAEADIPIAWLLKDKREIALVK